MPKSTVEQDDPYKIPEGIYLPAALESVEEKRIPFTYKKGERAGQRDELVKWVWTFKITAGEYAGLKSTGETDPKIAVFPDGTSNQAAQWIEALRGMKVEMGEGIDTDHYLGVPCTITVKHHARERGDGQGMFYSTPIAGVYPEGTAEQIASGAISTEDPPF